MVSAIRSVTSSPASRRACWTARTRSRARPSSASSGVTTVSSTTNPPPASMPVAESPDVRADDGLERVLTLDQRQPAGGHADAVLGDHAPVAGLRRLDRGLHVLAEPRAGGAGVDGEPLGDAVRRRLGRVGRQQPDLLHVDLVGHDRRERARATPGRRRRRSASRAAAGCGGRRPCAAPTSPSRPRGPGPWRRPGVVRRQRGGVRPVGEVHGPTAGQAAPDLLGRQRQQRRDRPAHDVEHRGQGLERLGPALPEALARAPDVPVRQHVEEAAGGLAGVGDRVVVELDGELLDVLPRLGEQVAVERVGAELRPADAAS